MKVLYTFVREDELVKPQEVSMLLLVWHSLVMRKNVKLFYIPSGDNLADLPTRPERISFEAANNMLTRGKQVPLPHARKLLRHAISKIEKTTRRHAPTFVHKLPKLTIK